MLAKTLDYMSILVAQIADLEAKNRSLESRAQHHHRHANGGSNGGRVVVLQGLMSGTSSSERVQVHVTAGAGDVGTSAASSPSAGPPPPAASREVETVRVHARAARGDVAELVARALAAIKGMGRFTVVAVDAGRSSDGGGDFAQATFTLRATVSLFVELINIYNYTFRFWVTNMDLKSYMDAHVSDLIKLTC